MEVHTIIMHLKELFDATSRIERYETFKEFFCYKMKDGSLMNIHVLKVISYIEKLGQLSFVMDHELSDTIQARLNLNFDVKCATI